MPLSATSRISELCTDVVAVAASISSAARSAGLSTVMTRGFPRGVSASCCVGAWATRVARGQFEAAAWQGWAMAYAIDLSGRVALVTASSRGIGRACALALARAGCDIVVNYRSAAAEAEEVVARIAAMGRTALAYQADVARSDEVDAMVAATVARWGRVDILVSNAGAGTRVPLDQTSDDEYRRVFDVNVKGFVAAARAVLPGMKTRRRGRVVAVSSIVGKSGKAFMSPSPTYAGAKAALLGYVKGLAREAAPFGITSNAVCPGWIDWGSKHAAAPVEVREDALRQIPLGRTGTPEDVAGGVVYLCSDEAAYVTGVSLDINGGLYMS